MIVRLGALLPLALVLFACADRPASLASVPAATPSATSSQPAPTPDPTSLATHPIATATNPPAPTSVPPSPTPIAPTSLATATVRPTAASRPTATLAPTATATPGNKPDRAASAAAPAHGARYVFPVRGDGKISYGRSHHDYPAADIFCPAGSEFVAVTDGVVDFVSREDRWEPRVNDGATRGGLSVAIVGDDGVRYYGSHLSEVAEGIAPGARVVAGQLLGRTGNSGDARVTAPHLHFGISHPTTPDDWQTRRGEIPPYSYLKAWQRGENVTP